MGKKINIKVTYGTRTQLIECFPNEICEKITDCFALNPREVELYSVKNGQRRRITPHDITDLMKIEVIPTKSTSTPTNQRTLRSYPEDDSAIQNIITKLKNNTPFNGNERKLMVDWLQIYSTSSMKKRKLDDASCQLRVCNKKVQVNMPSTYSSDSCTQTDLANEILDQEHNENEEISTKIKKLAVNGNQHKEEVARLMKKSFDDRRSFIFLKSPPVSVVKDKYPLLFSVEEVKKELGRIFYFDKCSEFINNMHKYAPFILQKCNPDEELYHRTEKSIDRAHTDVQKKYAKVVGSVFILTQLMEEEWRFIHLQDYAHGSDDIYPHIDASCQTLKEVFFDNFLYRIVVEGQLLCEASNLLEAILCLVASFFIFNIDYPDNCRRTFIAFEKLYLNADDTKDLDEHTLQMIKMLQLEANPLK